MAVPYRGAESDLVPLHVIEPTAPHTATVVFVHGLGQSNSSWKTLFETSLAVNHPHIRWVLPHAKFNPSPYNNGERRPSWYDIHKLPPSADEFDENSPLFVESLDTIKSVIQTEIESGIDASKLILMGFSQGASMITMTALTGSQQFGGVVSLSGWIPKRFSQALSTFNAQVTTTPVFWCHGEADQEIPLTMGSDAVEYMKSVGFEVEIKTYPGLVHDTNEEELKDVSDWLARLF
ncbi:Phospholipase/carboxylesterase/thioesterase [Flagelloscypha sp. PMI_526]|nr:Phospholipase/carboxylesterase/thioesterase [Flagelloscypha sp. PMI_526]